MSHKFSISSCNIYIYIMIHIFENLIYNCIYLNCIKEIWAASTRLPRARSPRQTRQTMLLDGQTNYHVCIASQQRGFCVCVCAFM